MMKFMTLMREAVGCSEVLVRIYQTTQCCVLEDKHPSLGDMCAKKTEISWWPCALFYLLDSLFVALRSCEHFVPDKPLQYITCTMVQASLFGELTKCCVVH
jgi:hypothetical protein